MIIPFTSSAADFSDPGLQSKMDYIIEHRNHKVDSRVIDPSAGMDADSAHTWDALHYNIEMEFFPSISEIDARVTITGISNDPGLDSLDVHLAQGLDIQAILVGWLAAGWSWDDDDLLIQLDRTYGVGDTFSVEVIYSGTPSMVYDPNAIGGMGMFWGNTVYTYTDPEGARAWFPCFDKPFDKATFSAQYTVPDGYIMAANGNPDSTVVNPNGTVTSYWTHDYPIETYLISIAMSNYAVFSDSYNEIPLDYYVYPGHLTAAQYDFQLLPEMMESMVTRVGDYPFEKYGMAEAPIFGGGGAMEHQTMTTLGHSVVTGFGSGEFLFMHELGHMWFGDALSLVDWPHVWLSEGFATYSEAIWAEHQYGWDYFLYYTQNSIQNVYLNWENSSNRHSIYDPPPGYLFSHVEYEKAASVLHMLRYYMGHDTFFDILNDYFETYKYGLVSTDDFQEECEEYYGDDLDWFFQQWVYGEGYPVFDYVTGITGIPGGDYTIALGVSQTQDAELPAFMTDIDVCVYSGGNIAHIETVWLSQREEEVSFGYSGPEPDSVRLDPDSWILGRKNYDDSVTGPMISFQDYEWSTEFLSQGGSADLVMTFYNSGIGMTDITGTFTSIDPDLAVQMQQIDFGNSEYMSEFSNSSDPINMALSSLATSHWAELDLLLEWTGGDTTITIKIPVGDPIVLYADDDGGDNTDSLSTFALDVREIVYRNWEIETLGLPSDLLEYEAVFWDCGHADSSLSTDEINLLTDYLQNDGGLFITGSELGSSIPNEPFLVDYLGLLYEGETAIPMINGVDSDPVGDGLSIFLNSIQYYNDIVSAQNNGVICFNMMNNFPCGVRVESNYKSVALTFAFSDIKSDNPNFNTPDEVLYNILNWLEVTLEVDEPGLTAPEEFSLLDYYPNPFNNEVNISYTLSSRGDVKLRVYNTLGQLAEELVNGRMSAGRHETAWNSAKFTSGVYFLSFEAGDNPAEIRKLILLK